MRHIFQNIEGFQILSQRIREPLQENLLKAADTYLMMDQSDRELWNEARLGNSSSFGFLFDRHAGAIYNFCFRRCGRWDLAEDLTSVVFLEAWRKRSVELESESALPWLYGIAANVVRNQNRSLRRHEAALARISRTDDTRDHADDVVAMSDDERQMTEVLSALSGLPEKEQDVLVLVAWEQLSYAETAEALGIPIGTVRSRLARARRRLGELVGRSGHNVGNELDLQTREEHT